MSWDDRYWYYRPAPPKKVKGGIKSQSKRGAFGRSWWAKRWMSVLESFNMGARLGRGRSYARQGQVASIEIDKGVVKAKVQGTRSRPYNVIIKVKTLTNAQWKQVGKVISGQAIFAAKLLSGEMRQDIEEVFKPAGFTLFPEKRGDLDTDCSCPDWANPCKHIAAVYILLGEEFDRDPFLVFKLRGITREELIRMIGEVERGPARAKKKAAGKKKLSEKKKDRELPPPSEPLPSDPSAFWKGTELADDFLGEVSAPRVNAALIKHLGNFPFWQGREPFLSFMESICGSASKNAVSVLLIENQIDHASD